MSCLEGIVVHSAAQICRWVSVPGWLRFGAFISVLVLVWYVWERMDPNRHRRRKLEPLSNAEFCRHIAFAERDIPQAFILEWRRTLERDICLFSRFKNRLRPEMRLTDIKLVEDRAHDYGWADMVFDDLLESRINPRVVLHRGTVAEIIVALWCSRVGERWRGEKGR